MKTIAQQKGITSFPYQEFDSNGKEVYYEDSNGFWYKKEYNPNGKQTYYENANRYWEKNEYDSKGNEVYYENSKGNEVYYENSKGDILNNRPKQPTELNMEYLIAKLKYLSNLDHCESADDMQNALEKINDLLNEQYPHIEEEQP